MSYTIRQLAGRLGREFHGDGALPITSVSGWDSSGPSSLVFLETGMEGAPPSGCGCVIAPPDYAPAGVNVIHSPCPKLDFTRAAAWLHPRPEGRGVRHPSAEIAPDAVLGDRVDVGPRSVVESGVRIGPGSILGAGVFVARGCVLGSGCVLHPGVVLYPGVRVGNRVILHAGAVVGADGFGYVSDGEAYWKFPQIGSVVIGDDVEIGANSTIDRGSLGTTRIGAGTKVDNLVQIAHNVEIGRHVVIAAQTGISGSTVIGDHAVIGGQVGFGDHARVEPGVVIGSKAGVLPGKIVRGGGVYWGVPVRPLGEYKRLNALFGRLPGMKSEIESLKKEVARLREALGGS
ncbi:MAG: UDP-3-O-(3-hydroxymyristoyl)glucosamine N-acyltransferase [Acidobacteriota bacterium]|nr:UDP-3-O-(3-hydroxymyristoyl)glucosamine N-acyltransferase [Acidobacteriota bacterium]